MLRYLVKRLLLAALTTLGVATIVFISMRLVPGGFAQALVGANATLLRETLDEEKTATGADPQPTSLHKGQKPRGGDEPNLSNRGQAGGSEDKAPPRRTG